MRTLQIVLGVVLAVLLGAALYEAAVALGALSLGSEPGAGPPGGEAVFAAAWLVLLAGGPPALLAAVSARLSAALHETRLLPFVAPAAAAFAIADLFSYDSYYAPTLRRHVENGDTGWLPVLAGAAVAAGALCAVRPRFGLVATGVVLWLALGTAIAYDLH